MVFGIVKVAVPIGGELIICVPAGATDAQVTVRQRRNQPATSSPCKLVAFDVQEFERDWVNEIGILWPA